MKGARKCSTSFSFRSASSFSLCRSVTPTPVIGSEEALMIFDYALAGLVTAGLMIYLIYALLRPERL
jgi:K+-transporting ATPase KdpF subunit